MMGTMTKRIPWKLKRMKMRVLFNSQVTSYKLQVFYCCFSTLCCGLVVLPYLKKLNLNSCHASIKSK